MQNMLSAVRLFQDTQRQAEEDSLTGLGNRRRFEDRLEHHTQTMNNLGIPFQLMICDLDHLKIINDSQGHQTGDQALVSLGHALQQHTTDGMEAFRIGGDEFAVLLDSARFFEAHALMRAMHQALPSLLTISAGVAASPAMGTTARVLFMAADWALYEAKKRGRDQLYPATLENLLLTLGDPQNTHSTKVLAALVDDHQGWPQDTTAAMAQWARDLAQDIGCDSEMQRTAELATLLQRVSPLLEFAPPGPARIKTHPGDYPAWDAEWLAAYPRLVPISAVLQAHNERWDGAGSPLGLKRREIPLTARIIAVVDYYSRLVASHRQPLAANLQTEIGNLLEKEAGTSLDPTLVRRWLDRSTHIPH
jgi:diguanylate cyclase (GGDEF)-like protein